MNARRHFVSLSLFPLLFLASTLAITIDNVTINYTNNQMTIVGKKLSLGTVPPFVTFNEINLRVVSASCTATDCVAIAILPSNTTAGSYRLTVLNPATGASFDFDVAYGVIGPQGQIGPPGPIGPQGPWNPDTLTHDLIPVFMSSSGTLIIRLQRVQIRLRQEGSVGSLSRSWAKRKMTKG